MMNRARIDLLVSLLVISVLLGSGTIPETTGSSDSISTNGNTKKSSQAINTPPTAMRASGDNSDVHTDTTAQRAKQSLPKEEAKEKDITEPIKNIAEVIAIGIGGLWALTLYRRQREKYQRVNLDHQVAHRKLSDGRILLSINVLIHNTGLVLMRICSGELQVRLLLDKTFTDLTGPFPPPMEGENSPRKFNWPSYALEDKFEKGPCEIEPGNVNQCCYEVLVPKGVNVLKVYTYYANQMKCDRHVGYHLTTIYDVEASRLIVPASTKMNGGTSDAPHKPTTTA